MAMAFFSVDEIPSGLSILNPFAPKAWADRTMSVVPNFTPDKRPYFAISRMPTISRVEGLV